jgi:ABC-type multidrug transport system fused ATPase/permease subunit
MNKFHSTISQARQIIRILSWVLGVKCKKIFFICIFLQVMLSSLDFAFLILIATVMGSLLAESAEKTPTTILNLFSLNTTQVFVCLSLIIGVKSILTLALRSWVLKSFADREAEVLVSFVQNSLLEDFESAKKSHSVDLLQMFTGVIGNIFSHILKPSISFAGDCLTIIGIFIGLVFFDPYIAVSIFIYFLLFGFFVAKILGRRQSKIGSQTFELNRYSLRVFTEIKLLSLELKLSNREDESIQKLFEARQKLSRLYARFDLLQATPRFIFEFLLVGGFTILIVVQQAFGQAEFNIVKLAVVVAAGYKVLPALNSITLNFGTARNSIPALYRIYQLGQRFKMEKLDIEYKKKLRKNLKQYVNGDILFSNVSYRYPGASRDVIKNLNYRIRAGQVTVVKGPSGAGKTTFINLTLGLLQPQIGSVKVVKNELEYLMLNQFSGIRYVSQEVALLDKSIGHNIAMRPITKFDEELLIKVAKSVGIYDWIVENQGGFNALVGENGSQISAGERQRLGIARAIFDSPKLMILDEPTANLDPLSERQIWDALKNIKGQMTMIIVSHRNVPESLYDDQLVLNKIGVF